jgi:hypothetical protein
MKKLHNKIWFNCKPYRDFLYWRFNRRFLKWVMFADRYKLYVHITPGYLREMKEKYGKKNS